MSTPHYAKAAAEALARRRIDNGRPTPEVRSAGIDAIRAAIELSARRERRRRGLVALGAIAAAGLAIFGAASALRSSPVVVVGAPPLTIIAHPTGSAEVRVDDTAAVAIIDGRHIPQGARLATGHDGNVTLSFSTGTRLEVDSNAELSMIEEGATQRFAIASGALRADVAKLGAGERFVLATPDAEIEVHGTSFRVAIVPADRACGEGSTTRLTVFDGVVSVRASGKEVRVPAGGVWPAGCASPSAHAETSTAAPAAPGPRVRHSSTSPGVGTATAAESTARSSTLAAQNDLFGEATAARQHGNPREAVAVYDRFLAKYPSGPLTESAMAERMTVLASFDPARARDAAERYLAAYPHGFARAEAESLRRPQ